MKIQKNLDECYPVNAAQGKAVMSWDEFMALGDCYIGNVDTAIDTNRPLFRAYTNDSNGNLKEVIHSAHTMLGVR